MTARTTTRTRARAVRRGPALPDVPVRAPHDLSAFIPAQQADVFMRAIRAARAAGVGFALGGGLAVAYYTGLWRPTKDIDLYIVPEDSDEMIEATKVAGLEDYFDTLAYDRKWIYRAHENGTIVDSIWALANSRAQVDASWIDHGPFVDLFGERVRLVGAEELIWSKIHVVQRERCDWPDLVNILYATGAHLDWDRLIRLLAGEERLLSSLLLLFSWLAPGRAAKFPEWIWDRLEIAAPDLGPERDDERIINVDSRPWFCD